MYKTFGMRWSFFVVWFVAFANPVAIAIWMLADGQFHAAVQSRWLRWLPTPDAFIVSPHMPSAGRTGILIFLLTSGLVSYMVILGAMRFGGLPFRSMRSLLLLVALSAVWIGLATQYAHIVEFGRVHRLAMQADGLIHFADQLNEAWDETWQGQGSNRHGFTLPSSNAYPVDRPVMCFFLGEYSIAGTHVSIRAIERTAGKAIRFELGGSNSGLWLERRYDNGVPTEFEGGLKQWYQPQRCDEIAAGLFVVHYRS